MSSKTKTIAADTKANVTPVVAKAAAVDVTTETKASASKSVKEKATATKTAATKTTTKKADTKKTAAKKTTVKKTAKTATAEIKTNYVLQFQGKEIVAKDVLETVKNLWVDQFQGKVEEIKTIDIYFKPEENRAYFVINVLSNSNYYIDL